MVVFSLFLGAMTLTPLFLLLYFVRRSKAGKPRLYKRLKKGRQLSGVCLGIAETTRLDVSLIRALFVLLRASKSECVYRERRYLWT